MRAIPVATTKAFEPSVPSLEALCPGPPRCRNHQDPRGLREHFHPYDVAITKIRRRLIQTQTTHTLSRQNGYTFTSFTQTLHTKYIHLLKRNSELHFYNIIIRASFFIFIFYNNTHTHTHTHTHSPTHSLKLSLSLTLSHTHSTGGGSPEAAVASECCVHARGLPPER